MKHRGKAAALVFVALAFAPQLAFAHAGHGTAAGLLHGFNHPAGGLDHILAMVTVGVFAAFLGGRALWAVPLSFVAMMAAGGALGLSGAVVPFVEIGIALSVVALGALVALRATPTISVAMAMVGLFAVFHGFAHGAEMPADASGLAYASGFLAATSLLHAAGIALGITTKRLSGLSSRIGGGLVSLAGVGLLAGWF